MGKMPTQHMGKMPTLPWLPRKQPRCSHATQNPWIPAFAGMTRGPHNNTGDIACLGLGSSMVIGYLVIGYFFVIRYSSLIPHSGFGIRHLLFSYCLFAYSLLPIPPITPSMSRYESPCL